MEIPQRQIQKIEKFALSSHTYGSYGVYYQYSRKRGIKILHWEYDTYQEAITSFTYRDAIEEMRLLKRGKKKMRYIPRCYGIKILHLYGKYRIGIILQHLDGDNREELISYDETNNLRVKLKKSGIFHSDLHHRNVIKYKGNWWTIDFGPGNVTIN